MYQHKFTNAAPPSVDSPRPRLLIVDDSVVVRSAIDKILTDFGHIEVVDKLPHIDAAIQFLSQNCVDLILLDHEMPGLKGLDALPQIIQHAQGARIAMLSGHCLEGSERAVKALSMGASDIIEKPSLREYNDGFTELLCSRLMRLALPQAIPSPALSTTILRPIPPNFRMTCLGIGASTGGIHALNQLLSGHKHNLGVPILITQHLPATFIPYFATQISRVTSLPVALAQDGETLRSDQIYIAPGEANLVCHKSRVGRVQIRLSTERASRLDPMPGVDPMFASMADCFGAGSVGVILTGMGRDGGNGAKKIVGNGGLIVTQDEASSVVWGMPGYATQCGLSSAVLPPNQIWDCLTGISGGRR